MQRFGWMGQLKSEMVQKYVQLHANTWPSVLARIKRSHLANYSIFLKTLPGGERWLFSYAEYTGDDFDQSGEREARSTVSRPECPAW